MHFSIKYQEYKWMVYKSQPLYQSDLSRCLSYYNLINMSQWIVVYVMMMMMMILTNATTVYPVYQSISDCISTLKVQCNLYVYIVA